MSTTDDAAPDLGARLGGLSAEKQALLARMLAARAAARGGATEDRIAPRADGPAPLSYAQELLWLYEQMTPGTAAYNVPMARRVRGPLDVAALSHALDALVARHESLRTTFVQVDGAPRQIAEAPRPVAIAVHDLRALGTEAREAEGERLLREAAAQPFDLGQGTWPRAVVVRLAEDEALLLVVIHHIVFDGGSVGVFFAELAEAYAAAQAGRALDLPALPIQLADYAAWERGTPTSAAGLEFWKQELAGAPASIELPTDRPRSGDATGPGARTLATLPIATRDAVRTLARAHDATPFMVLLAAVQVLLARYSGQDDLVVGVPIAGRSRGETERLVGYLANTLALRARLTDDPSMAELLRRTRERVGAAFEHQTVPYELIATELRGARTTSALFTVLLALQDQGGAPSPLGTATLEPFGVDAGAAKAELALSFTEREDGLRAVVEYRADLFDADTIDRMLGHLGELLAGAAAAPDTPVSRLPLVTDAERERQLVTWNDTDAAWPTDATLHGLFEAQVRARPDAVAVESEGTRLTYAELDARANRLAWALRAQGVGPDALVAVCMEKSADVVAVLLGILKAGGAYVPIDPAYPDDRIAFTLADSKARIVVTDAALVERLAPTGVTPLVAADAWAPNATDARSDAPPASAGSANLCYVIYTSGSTGQPKGVLIEHRNVVRLLFNDRFQFDFDERDVWTVFHSFSFDFSVWEMYGALLKGGRVIVVPKHVAQDPSAYLALLERERVTVLNQVPSAFYALMNEALARSTPPTLALRWVIFGGEALQPALLREWKARYPHATLVNMFGITETTVHVTFKVIGDAEIADGASNIGGPIPTLTTYVLDQHLQPVPLGVTGELCVGGWGVARGYLERPELTAERFVPHPFRAGERLYRSGDLGRQHPSGEIEYLGRRDAQVKVRGFRIELGEIEAALANVAGVRAVAVIARPDAAGQQRLLGYVVPEPGRVLLPNELRDALRERLPEHMVPQAITLLDAIPTTANGKTDAKALPEPQVAASAREYVAPRTPTEEAVAGAFAEVLGAERVGTTDDFYALGGHSLVAIRVAGRLQAKLGRAVPLRAIFEHPSVEALARALDGEKPSADDVPHTDIPVVDRAAHRRTTADGDVVVLPASSAQARLWFIEELDPGQSTYNVPIAWRLRGALDTHALQRAVDFVVARHEVLRTTLDMVDDAPVQVIHAPRATPIAVHDLRGADAEARGLALLREQAQRPFDLRTGPVVRFTLARVADDEHLLLVALHHVAADWPSVAVLARDLGEGYAAAVAGGAPHATPLPVQYADHASHVRETLTTARTAKLERYWRETLYGPLPVLELPMRAPRPKRLGQRPAGHHAFDVPADVAARLDALARDAQATTFMAYLAAFQLLLGRYSAHEDVIVGTPMSGRTDRALEGLVGMFLNTLAIRTDLSGAPSFRALLDRVRKATLGAFAHDALPFERVIDVAKPPRDESITPIFQALFTLQNAADPRADASSASPLRGLSGERVPLGAETTKYDLQLTLATDGRTTRALLEYDASLFDAETMATLARHFVTLLAHAVETPDAPAASLPMLAEAERAEILASGTAEPTPLPSWTTPERIVALARETPNAIAVRADDATLTYGALMAQASRLAQSLGAAGVQPGDRVGVCVDRTSGLVVSLLGTWFAGAAYVPLDPAYPADRIAHVLSDADAKAVITDAASRGSLPAVSVPVLDVHDIETTKDTKDTKEGDGSSFVPFVSFVVNPEQPAYVIYTSGSTGKPKGVVIPHRALTNFLASMAERPGMEAGDAVVAVTTISFDIAGLELWLPLTTGAEVVLASRNTTIDGEALRALVESTAKPRRAHRVWLQATPVTWRLLLGAGWRGTPNLVMLCGGEGWPPGLADELVIRGEELWNVYGPTETTIWSSRARITGSAVPLGEPLANTALHVLEPSGEPAPFGVPGELWIGGAGLASGYHGRPDLTAERFVERGALGRLYRTGDRVRRRADGTLEYMGRLDHQVKVRGFRVELGEIENVLIAQPEIESAVVLVREDVPGDQRLVAYCIGEDPDMALPRKAAAASLEQRDRLRKLLPGYMVPSAFVWLEAWPLTPNGKLDRKALPAPDLAMDGATDAPVAAPATPVEEILAGVWMEVLRLPRVGVESDFFDLGGHSLLAMQAVARVAKLFGRQVALRTFFGSPTIRGFAAALVASEPTPGRTDAVARALVKLQRMSPEERERLRASRPTS